MLMLYPNILLQDLIPIILNSLHTIGLYSTGKFYEAIELVQLFNQRVKNLDANGQYLHILLILHISQALSWVYFVDGKMPTVRFILMITCLPRIVVQCTGTK